MKLSKEYINAIKEDNAEKVLSMLRDSANDSSFCKEIFLHAAQHNKINVLKSMATDMHVDINTKDDNGRNALDKIVRVENNEAAIEFLLDHGVTVNKSVLSDKEAKLKEETKKRLTEVYNKQREDLKVQLQKEGPQVIFETMKDGKHVTKATVSLKSVDNSTSIAFYFVGDDRNLDLCVSIDDMKTDHYTIDKDSKTYIVDEHRKQGIIPHLKEAEFKGNAESLNRFVSEAQKVILKKWPETEKELQAAEKQKEDKRLASTDKTGQALLNEYGFLFNEIESTEKKVDPQEDKRQRILANKKRKNDADNKLAQARKKLAQKIDKTLGTNLKEKKLPDSMKKIERKVSDTFLEKAKE